MITLKILLIILIVLFALCVTLLVSVVYIKMNQAKKEKKRKNSIEKIKPYLKKLFAAETIDFFKNHGLTLSKLDGELKEKASRETLEDLLLYILEYNEGERRVRARTIAYYFGFPEKCLSMINDRLTGNIAIGCRKAGLYQYDDAIPGILKALTIVSSETQLQALMALARIGDVAAMIEAFDRIHRLILINERAVNEVLNIFSGDRFKLYKSIIYHQSDYLVRLLLKAIDRETANELIEDIAGIYKTGGKETRLACIIAIGTSGNSSKNYMLINALNDREWEIRAMAAKMLGSLADPGAITLLARAARDREWWVRQNAVTSILAYENREEILVSIAETGDKYAFDSMQYTLGKSGETELLSTIRGVWKEEHRSIKMGVS